MCGRTACTLNPGQLCKACSGNKNRRYQGEAKWREVPGDAESYQPRFNLGPSVYSPVLLGGHHFSDVKQDEEESDGGSVEEEGEYERDDLVIQPMLWGLVPAYHKGKPKEFRYKTINARAEGLTEKQTFRVPLSKGRRCVVLADGFYEWQRGPKGKQPYFIYFPQENDVHWDHPEMENGENGWNGRRVLTMAGIFEINRNGDSPLYSYTIVTVPASKTMSWMHNRMPALLDGDEAVDKWLDSENVPLKMALELLKPVNHIDYHAVTPQMGNVKTQGPECVLPYENKKSPSPKGGTKLTQFFKPKRQAEASESESEESDDDDDGQGPAPKKTPRKKK